MWLKTIYELTKYYTWILCIYIISLVRARRLFLYCSKNKTCLVFSHRKILVTLHTNKCFRNETTVNINEFMQRETVCQLSLYFFATNTKKGLSHTGWRLDVCICTYFKRSFLSNFDSNFYSVTHLPQG